MWRAGIAATVLWASASIASACIADAGLTGIVFDQPPEDAPDDALILAVSFADLADDTPIDDVLKARVTNVIQGDYRSDYVPVEIPSDSCARPSSLVPRASWSDTYEQVCIRGKCDCSTKVATSQPHSLSAPRAPGSCL